MFRVPSRLRSGARPRTLRRPLFAAPPFHHSQSASSQESEVSPYRFSLLSRPAKLDTARSECCRDTARRHNNRTDLVFFLSDSCTSGLRSQSTSQHPSLSHCKLPLNANSGPTYTSPSDTVEAERLCSRRVLSSNVSRPPSSVFGN